MFDYHWNISTVVYHPKNGLKKEHKKCVGNLIVATKVPTSTENFTAIPFNLSENVLEFRIIWVFWTLHFVEVIQTNVGNH